MQDVFLGILQDGAMIIAGLAFTALSALGTFYIKKLIGFLQEKEALQIVSRYVRWAEQAPAFQDFSGEQKFELVFSKAMQWLKDKGININEDEVAIMVEEAVQVLKSAASPIYYGIE